MTAGCEYPGAFGEPCPLIPPVVEGGCAEDKVVRGVGRGKLLSDSDQETQPLVASRIARDPDHSRCRVDSCQFRGCRQAISQLPEDIAGPAPDVEHPSRRWHAGHGKVHGAVGDPVMKPPQPARLIPGRALIKRPHVTVIRHGRVWHGDRYDVTYPAAHAREPDAGIKNRFYPSPPSRRSCKQGRWSMARAPVRGWTDHDRGPPGRRGGTDQIRAPRNRDPREAERGSSRRVLPGLRGPGLGHRRRHGQVRRRGARPLPERGGRRVRHRRLGSQRGRTES